MKIWLRKLIKQELDLYVGRLTAHRARAKILKEIIGDVDQEFKRLYDYRGMILQTNPVSTCVVKEEDQGDGKLVFSKIYVCLHAMKRGWLEGCRRIICLDGCFLKGVCKGQLLVAVSKDENNQIFPIVLKVVEVENTFNWTWFTKCMSEELGLEDGRDLTIMSDIQKVYQDNLAKSMKCTPRWNGETGYEIKDPKYKQVVSLVNMTYSCRACQLKDIPCCHAIASMHFKDMEPIHHIAHWYRNHLLEGLFNIYPACIVKREKTEHPKSGKLSRRVMEMTCSLYGVCGHNKRGFPTKKTVAGNATARNVVPNGTPSSAAERGRGRGRGR
ncbi:uncharacterized protein [Nicotiana sylvestris]|uniref:uncharacterized protein n=1 Tax=Nicotiana sylvestris TaxID=4096 RepID=UPI00388CBE88